MLPEHADVLAEIEQDWAATGLSGSLLARNLDTGVELGFGAGVIWPLASVIKLPVALVIHDAFRRGDLDPDEPFEIDPQSATRGPTGVALFRHPSRIAAEDLVQLSLSVSDNAAMDLLLQRLGLEEISRRIAALGFEEIVLRHEMNAIYGVAGSVAGLNRGLASAGSTPGGGHLLPELDPHRANAGTARALLELLDRLWTDRVADPQVCARVRAAAGRQLVKHRLAVELAADGVRIAGKTGTFLDLRHEIGVVETGQARVAVVALTRSSEPAEIQMEAEFAIGHAARLLVDALRG